MERAIDPVAPVAPPRGRRLGLPRFGPAPGGGGATRFAELDGLRGWAALSVVCFHLVWECFGLIVPWVRNPATAFLLNGGLAVSVFFVLSGEALSAAYFAGKGDRAVANLAIRRWSRLSLPILATCLIVWALISLGLDFHRPAAVILHRQDWLAPLLSKRVTLAYVFQYGLGGVYGGVDGAKAIVPFLWTMKTEMVGSAIIFLLLFSFRWVPFAFAIIGVVATGLLLAGHGNSQSACFLFGLLFCALRGWGVFARLRRSRPAVVLSWAAVAIIAVLVGYARELGIDKSAMPLFAVPLVFAIFCNPTLCAVFQAPVSQWLGKLSFPLYLMQFPVLISFTSWAVVTAGAQGPPGQWTALMISAASILTCLAAAWAFQPVERGTHVFGRWLTGAVWGMVDRVRGGRVRPKRSRS